MGSQCQKNNKFDVAEGWSQLYGKPLSQDECKEICDNLNGFFSVLKQWEENLEKIEENEGNSNLGNSNNSSQA